MSHGMKGVARKKSSVPMLAAYDHDTMRPCQLQVKQCPSLHRISRSSLVAETWPFVPLFLLKEWDLSACMFIATSFGDGNFTPRSCAHCWHRNSTLWEGLGALH